ncbi:MAG: SDR family NAD(P)-dependent oxidoreductase [bacterium]|nr:SDR family NAD(P)-dependent oxidoreductase [bacterium]
MSTDSNAGRRVLVTGGSSGIGRALCRQLAVDEGCDVLLGARDRARGEEVVASIRSELRGADAARVELVVVDVTSDQSVARAVSTISEPVYALVNNAGTGLAHGVSPSVVVETNLYGPKRMVEAMLGAGLISDRIVNVGSGSGPGYVRRCPSEVQPALCTLPADWAAIEALLEPSPDGRSGFGSEADANGGYGISKALLSLYSLLLARAHPDLVVSCCSPGWIRTRIVGHEGPSKGPEEGTAAIKQCLFGSLEASGWYYGSDGLRSPYHYMRNPGEPEWDGNGPGA